MWKKWATELAVTGKLFNTVFYKCPKFNEETGAFCGPMTNKNSPNSI